MRHLPAKIGSNLLLLAVTLGGLLLARQQSYLLFHSLVELFSVVVACGIFMVAWNSRRFHPNNYLVHVGIAYLFVAVLDVMHLLAYHGMPVFQRRDPDLATQLWVAARGMQAIALLAAPLLIGRRLNAYALLAVYGLGAALLLVAIFPLNIFPQCFQEGVGLTAFKKTSEFVICLMLLVAVGLLLRKREQFDGPVLSLIVWSLLATIASEVLFARYVGVEDSVNWAGHALKLIAFYMIYRAIVVTGLARPYDMLFRDLNQSREALRHSEDRYRSLAESSRNAIGVARLGQWIFMNPAGARLFGAERVEELVGRSLLDLVHPEDREMIGGQLDKLEEQELHAHMRELRILRLDGQAVSVEAVATRIMYRGLPATQVLIEDITRQKQAREQLEAAKSAAEAANRAKDQFMAVLSHELRNPLNPVLVTVSAMEQRPDLSQQVRADLGLIRRNVELEARLIDDLLDLTRIAKGKLDLSPQRVDAHLLLTQALEICRGEADAKALRIAQELSAERHWVMADPARLQQIYWNLIKNAVKFTSPGGLITLRSQDGPADGNGHDGPPLFIVEVIDSGIGIEPAALGQIFDAFTQGSAQISRQFGGLGLGLAITKALVEMHGGSIAASSAGSGQGASFGVSLPVAESALPEWGTPRGLAEAPQAAQTRSLSILLVEDHDDTLRIMTRLLESMNHQVRAAGSVERRLQAAGAGPLDLVISDLGLPDGSGLELMRQLKIQYGLKGICLSGFGMESDLIKSKAAGFSEHLTKPIDFERLAMAIQRVMG